MDFAIELRNGGLCLYFLKNGRKMGDVSFTWEQAEWLYRQIGQLVIDFKNIHKTDVSKREEQIHYEAVVHAENQPKPTDYVIAAKADHFNGFVEGFEEGAEWADEHPSLHVVASLMHLLRSGRIDTTTTNADVLTQLQIELKNRDKTNQSKVL